MSDDQSPLASGSPGHSNVTLESLEKEQQDLRRTLHVTLCMFLVLTGSLFVFFLREVSLARRQIAELRKVVMDYEKDSFPMMENFRVKLQAFAQTHPDFNGIYTKYFGAAGNSNNPSLLGRTPVMNNSNSVRLPPGNR